MKLFHFFPIIRLSVKLLRLLQNYPPPDDPGVRGRLNECLETILNKAQEPPKSKKVMKSTSICNIEEIQNLLLYLNNVYSTMIYLQVQHSNAKNAVLFEAISLIIHNDR